MSSFEIVGGYKLQGEIHPQGAKNEALQVLCAVLLTGEKVVIDNIPDIRDVNKLIGLLELLGVKTRRLNSSPRGAAMNSKPTRSISTCWRVRNLLSRQPLCVGRL